MAAARAEFGDRAAARVEAVLSRHHAALMWIARRWSGSRDEAEDALQRALEIYLRRLDTIDPASELAWLKVVVRNEALALRRAHAAGQPLDEEQLADRVPATDPAVDERAERAERNARSLEALAQLKPDERTALLLKGQGYSYREIGELKGWTHTKVNRAITEGRRRFLSVFASIESGEECLRFAPTLIALVQGEAASADVVALRPHLRHCAGCRATVRELHASRLHRLALHLPFLAGVAPARWLGDRLTDAPDAPRGDFKGLLGGALNRLNAPDVAAGVQMASSGGGRGPAVAALLGLCLSGGAGTYCLATGALPDPTGIVRRSEAGKKPHEKPAGTRRTTKAEAAATPTASPAPAVPPEPHRPVVTAHTRSTKPESRRARTADRSGPQQEFGFESSTGSSDPPPSSATTATTATTANTPPSALSGGSTPSSSPPPTSGGEFLP